MTNADIAAAFSELGTLLELKGENPFRTQSYHAVARVIDQLTDDVAKRVLAGDLGKIPGVGDAIREKIEALVTTGSIPQLEELRASTPPGLLQMLRVPGLGPKKVRALADAGYADPKALKAGCLDGSVAKIKGFGAKTQTNILNGLSFIEKAGGRIRIDAADALSQPILQLLKGLMGVHRAEACGSLRRRRETIGDLDFLVSADAAGPVMDAFGTMPQVAQVLNRGDTLTSVLLNIGAGPTASAVRADLRVVTDEQFPFALAYFTGSKEHNIVMRSRAQDRGLKLNEYELAGSKGRVACKSEDDIFQVLGLTYVPPELREDTGEFAACEKHTLPNLITGTDIRGVFHNHTTASDGTASMEEMAAAAQQLGFEYLGIADHSQSLVVARGLSPERIREQHRQIDALNRQFKNFRIFKGTECDILPDGTLDYDDETLASFDYVVASVHTQFQQSREEVTTRIIRAIRHPRVTMLGHATGRLLLQRDGYPVDLGQVLAAAAETGTMIEINAQPKRLDIDWIHARRAKELGVPIVINPDAHATEELALFRYGVDVARRAWLTVADVVNTRSTSDVEKLLRHKTAQRK